MSAIKLRKWQETAGDLAIRAFSGNQDVWVTEACTGSGKTLHGADVAKRLIDSKIVDLVVVITPSIATRGGWVKTLNNIGIDASDNSDHFAIPDFQGLVITYGGDARLLEAFYHRPVYKGFVLIVDEYHHGERDAAWGATITTLERQAIKSIFLSGTPWRSTGQIAVLSENNNRHGNPYYDGDRVAADFKYQYSEDLKQDGDNRGTIPVEFIFVDSQHTSQSGKVERLVKPELSKMPEHQREEWIEKAKASTTSIGKHFRTQGSSASDYQLSANSTVRGLIGKGFDNLEEYRIKSKSDVPVLLIVTQNIKEARAVYAYTLEVQHKRSALIVSDKDKASDELLQIQDKCRKGMLDVIVSVGMVSEGVDIPQIKGVVYLSSITTYLYLVQVIGRLLRRIKTNSGYMDQSVNHLPGFFLSIAAPKLVACGYMIEKEISEALERTIGGGEGHGPGVEPEVGVVSSNGDEENIYRGSSDNADIKRGIEAMLTHEKAEDCHVDSYWKEWVVSMILRGDKKAREEAMRQINERCNCLGIKFGDVLHDAVSATGLSLSMDEMHKLASREAEDIRSKLRWRLLPFKEIENHETAYKKLNIKISNRAKLNCSFTKATIEQKRHWIATANQMLQEGGVA